MTDEMLHITVGQGVDRVQNALPVCTAKATDILGRLGVNDNPPARIAQSSASSSSLMSCSTGIASPRSYRSRA
jgi:hypothetical protein